MKNHILTCLALGIFSSPLCAQNYGPSAGDREVTLAGTGSSDGDFDNHTFGISGAYGWYLTDQWEVNLRQSIDYAERPGSDAWNGSTRIGADYHFGSDRWRVYVGANTGAVYGDLVNDTWMAAPEFGVKYYVKPETFIFYEAEYQFFFEDAEDIDDVYDDGSYVHALGVGFNF